MCTGGVLTIQWYSFVWLYLLYYWYCTQINWLLRVLWFDPKYWALPPPHFQTNLQFSLNQPFCKPKFFYNAMYNLVFSIKHIVLLITCRVHLQKLQNSVYNTSALIQISFLPFRLTSATSVFGSLLLPLFFLYCCWRLHLSHTYKERNFTKAGQF